MTEENKKTNPEVEENAPAADAAGKKFNRPAFLKTRGGITATVIIAVVVVAALGFWGWHNTPSFCGSMCHDSMGYYLDSYENDTTTLAYQHGHVDGEHADTLKAGVADKGVNCLGCHPASLDLQIIEFTEQMAGTYTMDTDGKVVVPNKNFEANKEFCLQCHDYEKVVAATANYNGGKHDAESGVFNPHASHQGDLECGTCHQPHGTSTLYCASCHNAELPEGWEAPSSN